MQLTRGTAAKARRQCTRMGTPQSEKLLGRIGGGMAGSHRVPIPAAGRTTKTRINSGVYRLESLASTLMAIAGSLLCLNSALLI